MAVVTTESMYREKRQSPEKISCWRTVFPEVETNVSEEARTQATASAYLGYDIVLLLLRML